MSSVSNNPKHFGPGLLGLMLTFIFFIVWMNCNEKENGFSVWSTIICIICTCIVIFSILTASGLDDK